MAYSMEAAVNDMNAGKPKKAVERLWNAYYSAFGARDIAALRDIDRLAGELARHDLVRERATSLQERVGNAIRDITGDPISPEERARREELAREEARATVKERLDLLRASRQERDVHAVACFEYSVISGQPDAVADSLNQAGALGWDLASAIGNPDGSHTLYFRRPVVAMRDDDGQLRSLPASALSPIGRISQTAGGGGGFAAFYYESGSDFDADGDVDGGLFDSIQNLFG